MFFKVAIARKLKFRFVGLFALVIILLMTIKPVVAQVTEATVSVEVNTLWLIVAGSLIFFMNAGFAMLEAGLCQTRNATNVLAKNLIVFCVSILAYWICGFGLMFGNGNSWIGATGFFFKAFDPPLIDSFNVGFDSLDTLYPGQPWMVVFFFQLVFAGTTATIVSGAMAERVKFWAFFWFSFLLVAIAYPLTGRWVWNPAGWLTTSNFLDFAGSTVVHSVGGMAGLVGAILIGPRRGWQGFNPDEIRGNRFSARPQSFRYYNLSLSTLGCLILWLGWLGFNGGSAGSIPDTPHVIVTTMLAGAAGGVFILLLRGVRGQKPGLPLVINGILGGLVSITASSIYVSLAVAILIGAISSLWILVLERLLKKLRIDDPVGAIPVHLGCGIWGTLAAGLFVNQLPPYLDVPIIRLEQILIQVIGIFVVNSTILVLSLSFWLLIGLSIYTIESANSKLKSPTNQKANDDPHHSHYRGWYKYLHYARSGIRVSKQEEVRGSDGTFS
ncbi:MAG: ammonium permease [Cyanobacteria bacterium P01_G01_bin.39]